MKRLFGWNVKKHRSTSTIHEFMDNTMKPTLNDQDRQRIEQEADKECGYSRSRQGFLDGAEYATLYERERQLMPKPCPYCGPDGTIWNGESSRICPHCKGSGQWTLEADRTELIEKVLDKLTVLKNQSVAHSKPYSSGCIDTIDIIEDFLNSLKTK